MQASSSPSSFSLPALTPNPQVAVNEAHNGASVSPVEQRIVSPTSYEQEETGIAPPSIPKSGPGRKSRACNECKRQKMKCELSIGSRKCKHCSRRNIDCSLLFARPSRPIRPDHGSVDRSSASGDAYDYKIEALRNELYQMRTALDTLVERGGSINMLSGGNSHSGMTQHNVVATPQSNTAPSLFSQNSAREDNMQMAMTRENSIEPDQGPGADQNHHGAVTVEEPMSSLYEVTRLRNIRSNQGKTIRQPDGGSEVNDFISRGVITEREAQELYITFHTSLNHYLWVGLEQIHASLLSVRRSSQILAATIMTVTALHNPTSTETFDKCYKEFLSLISSSMFSRYHSIDDVRGLCIAAFWLSDVSWKLSGHAIRIATELNIHQSFYRALNGDREHFLKARLWYMLYVCDHHFSIAYGRPPMISESLQIRDYELFLQVPLADGLDKRILSQVHLMQILTRIHERFAEQRMPSQDPSGAALNENDFVDMRNFNLEVDQWRMKWQARQEPNHFIGTFPPNGIIMYSYFAKLQLNSLAVRGVSVASGRLSTERKEFANAAISAAASILTFVLEEDDMRRALIGMPLYFHTMIAFASVFLMKVTTKWNRIIGLNVEPHYVTQLLERTITLLKNSITSDRHLLHHIADGVEKMLAKSQAVTTELGRFVDSSPTSQAAQMSQYSFNPQHAGYDGMPQMNQMAAGYANGSQHVWDPSFTGGMNQPNLEDMTIMNDGWIHEAFGSDSANAVYNLLANQFS